MSEAALAAAGGALLGAIGGSQKDRTRQEQRMQLAPMGQGEFDALQGRDEQFSNLRNILAADNTRDRSLQSGVFAEGANLAQLLSQLGSRSGLPTAAQTQQAQDYASQIFAPEKQQLSTFFRESEEATNQLAAQLGRPTTDPILRAKLAEAQGDALGQVAARQTTFGAEFAQSLPQRQLQLQQSLLQLRQGLAGQALQNRMTILGLGSEIAQADRQFRLGSATQFNNMETGGGVRGAALGGIAGAAAMMNATGGGASPQR